VEGMGERRYRLGRKGLSRFVGQLAG